MERRLANNPSRRSAALLVALRNLNRLVVPAVGAGLFFAAFDRAGLFARADAGRFFALPPFVLVLIATGWIAGSLLAPKHRAFRPMPLDDDAARAGYRLVLYLGVVLSLAFLVAALTIRWSFTLATQSALLFPLVILGALGLWRVADRIAEARDHIAEGTDSATSTIVGRLLRATGRVLRVVAVVAPLLGAAGYMPAAGFLVFRSILTIGLLAGAFVIFDLLNKIAQSVLTSPTASRQDDGGLAPVFVGALVVVASLPLLAIIWGARPSDIADFWMLMREGVTLGGIRLSATVVLTLIVVFGIGAAVVRLLQTVLRGTVLPRTRTRRRRQERGARGCRLHRHGDRCAGRCRGCGPQPVEPRDRRRRAVGRHRLRPADHRVELRLRHHPAGRAAGEGGGLDRGRRLLGLRQGHQRPLDRDRDLRPGQRHPAELGSRSPGRC